MSAAAAQTFPRGWFAICFSREVPPAGTLACRYFGQDLAVFRGEDGQIHVLDAYCKHMGAHLAVGSKVRGNCVECPFHAWVWDGDGRCVEIPYAQKIPRQAQTRSWKAQEANGLVFVHHDPHGEAPEFPVPEIAEVQSDEWLPWTTTQYHIKTHPREIVDNLADRAHFRRVHDTEIESFAFEVEGYRATQYVKGKAFLADGGVDPFSSTTTYHGPGILVMQMDGLLRNYMIFTHTPVDEGALDLRLSLTLKIVGSREKTEGYVEGYLSNLRQGFEDDIKIWENKVYMDPPLLCDGDGPIGRLRRWYRQFYDPNARVAGQKREAG